MLLKSYQRLAYFPKLADVPAAVVSHLRAVGLPAGVAAVYETGRTLWRHQRGVAGQVAAEELVHEQLMDWDECAPLVPAFCAQAGIPTDAPRLTDFYRRKLTAVAAAVDAGYPDNTDLVLEDGRPMLRRRKGVERRPSALALERREQAHHRHEDRQGCAPRSPSGRAGCRR